MSKKDKKIEIQLSDAKVAVGKTLYHAYLDREFKEYFLIWKLNH